MIKKMLINFFTKLLRASLVRITNDIEITRKILACVSSAKFVESSMCLVKPVETKRELMLYALHMSQKEGFICELGVYQGESLNYLADHLPEKTIYGFDTFAGLPQTWRHDYPEGCFKVEFDTLKFRKNCTIYKGFFHETLPVFLQEVKEKASLIHIDCDLYTSTAEALKCLQSRIQSGTILVFDEYFNYPTWEEHEHKAFMEFIAESGMNFEYICYNKKGEQVAIKIC